METKNLGAASIEINVKHISQEEFETLNRNVKRAVRETIHEMKGSFDGTAYSTFDPYPTQEPVRIPVDDALPTPFVEMMNGMELYLRSVVQDELTKNMMRDNPFGRR